MKHYYNINGAKLTQKGLLALGGVLRVDGWLGDKTIAVINSLSIMKLEREFYLEHNLNQTSLRRLKGVHPKIITVVKRASLYTNIFVVEGLRTQRRQVKLVKSGNSQISNSYHLYGLAVDLAAIKNGKVLWNDMQSYKRIHKAINRAEIELGYNVIDNAMFDLHWRTLTDYPHYQMSTRFVKNRNPRKFFKKHKGLGF